MISDLLCRAAPSQGMIAEGRGTPKHNPDPRRLGNCMAYRGGAQRRPRPEGGSKSAATTESNSLPFKRC
jgi:hypothetical protein